jgi:hypothetical protein
MQRTLSSRARHAAEPGSGAPGLEVDNTTDPAHTRAPQRQGRTFKRPVRRSRLGTPVLERTLDMAKFIYLYRGPATPMADLTPEQGAERQAGFGAWMEKVGAALVDVGSPFSGRVRPFATTAPTEPPATCPATRSSRPTISLRRRRLPTASRSCRAVTGSARWRSSNFCRCSRNALALTWGRGVRATGGICGCR